jgi:hypothetical protein
LKVQNVVVATLQPPDEGDRYLDALASTHSPHIMTAPRIVEKLLAIAGAMIVSTKFKGVCQPRFHMAAR